MRRDYGRNMKPERSNPVEGAGEYSFGGGFTLRKSPSLDGASSKQGSLTHQDDSSTMRRKVWVQLSRAAVTRAVDWCLPPGGPKSEFISTGEYSDHVSWYKWVFERGCCKRELFT